MDNRIEKAIHNIFKEDGYKIVMIDASGEIVARNRFDMQRVYSYKIKDDVITIKNKQGLPVYEKCISSYQEPFSFTIDK